MRSKKRQRGANRTEGVILASLLHGEKYGLELRDEYERRTGSAMPLGSLYVTLDRMVEKGFLRSRDADADEGRGGNRRRYFKVTADGIRAFEELNRSLHAVDASPAGVAHA